MNAEHFLRSNTNKNCRDAPQHVSTIFCVCCRDVARRVSTVIILQSSQG